MSDMPRDRDSWSRGTERNLPFIDEQVLLLRPPCGPPSFALSLTGLISLRSSVLQFQEEISRTYYAISSSGSARHIWECWHGDSDLNQENTLENKFPGDKAYAVDAGTCKPGYPNGLSQLYAGTGESRNLGGGLPDETKMVDLKRTKLCVPVGNTSEPSLYSIHITATSRSDLLSHTVSTLPIELLLDLMCTSVESR
ncbi:hypothetical protein BGZ61DRAFT_487894 [Ilyonectria robusta]|uniref:uncharacterized protein n=1 Tax=Ilyonectria robusta TaxID=1079257 RepID=UPI001E8E59F9|nr:uncharacterized protein BGZ61DRAFT_487894 [Ilyonectria robusta]KAH8650216.1 hypothetical protein BGZ61DRAFT_487894 [Ilyonectria robusta]